MKKIFLIALLSVSSVSSANDSEISALINGVSGMIFSVIEGNVLDYNHYQNMITTHCNQYITPATLIAKETATGLQVMLRYRENINFMKGVAFGTCLSGAMFFGLYLGLPYIEQKVEEELHD